MTSDEYKDGEVKGIPVGFFFSNDQLERFAPGARRDWLVYNLHVDQDACFDGGTIACAHYFGIGCLSPKCHKKKD